MCMIQLPAQNFDWVNAYPIQYTMNPAMPQHTICYSNAGLVFASQLDSSSLIYGQEVYGKQTLRCFNTSGTLQWSVSLGAKVNVARITTDNSGNLYLCGSFMDSLKISNSALTLANTGINFTTNIFLAKFNSAGIAQYLKNKTGAQLSNFEIAALAVNSQGELYCALQNFSLDSYITKVDAAGNDLQSYVLNEARTIGQISFDKDDNLYISGSTSLGTLTVNNFSITVPEQYMMFVSRINNSGQTSWIRLAHDITFQFPVVCADKNGNAFVAGALFDSTLWGNIAISDPQWVNGFFLVKVDSSGNFPWGVQIPATPTIQGDFARGSNVFIDDDGLGNVYITGITRGTINWGNNVTTGNGAPPATEISYMCFNGNGAPQWSLGSSSTSFQTSYAMDADSIGNCYFASGISGTSTFGSFTVGNGIGQFAVFGKISSSLVSFEQNDYADVIKILPNPASDFIKIITNTSSAKNIKSVSVRNIHGQIVVNENKFQPVVHVKNLANGIYILEVETNNGKIQQRFAKF